MNQLILIESSRTSVSYSCYNCWCTTANLPAVWCVWTLSTWGKRVPLSSKARIGFKGISGLLLPSLFIASIRDGLEPIGRFMISSKLSFCIDIPFSFAFSSGLRLLKEKHRNFSLCTLSRTEISHPQSNSTNEGMSTSTPVILSAIENKTMLLPQKEKLVLQPSTWYSFPQNHGIAVTFGYISRITGCCVDTAVWEATTMGISKETSAVPPVPGTTHIMQFTVPNIFFRSHNLCCTLPLIANQCNCPWIRSLLFLLFLGSIAITSSGAASSICHLSI